MGSVSVAQDNLRARREMRGIFGMQDGAKSYSNLLVSSGGGIGFEKEWRRFAPAVPAAPSGGMVRSVGGGGKTTQLPQT